MKKLILIALVAAALMPMRVGAYGVETHAAITQEMARFFNQFYPNHAFTIAEIKILMQGAVDEDDGSRPLNHFFDPVHKRGLTYLGQYGTSKSWAQDSVAQSGIAFRALATVIDPDSMASTDFTWKRAIRDYAEGKTTRGLEGLGHVLHLIEDLTVPAHVRNDPHPPKDTFGEKIGDDDPYELWSHKYNSYNINVLSFLKGKTPVVGLSNLGAYFDALAKYTNSKFFSNDTVYEGRFPNPNIETLVGETVKNGTILSVNDIEGKYVIAYRSNSYTPTTKTSVSTDSDIVSQSTWNRLSPKAVQYGAGVIDLFFREVEKLKNDPNFKPIEQKSLLGQFIDSVGENVGALIDGPPIAQPVVTVQPALQPVVEEASEAQPTHVAESGGLVVTPEVVPISVPSPEPVVSEKRIRNSSGSSDENSEEPAAEPVVIEQGEIVTNPEPEVATTSVTEADTTPPAIVVDLQVTDADEGTVSLRWTAPGDDENVGTAASYELRYSTDWITADTWSAAIEAGFSADPKATGAQEAFAVSGLISDTRYYLGIKSKDEGGNESLLSNIVEVRTRRAPLAHLVISEIYPDMTGADTAEFVELYNPTSAAIDLSGYSLQYLSGSATASTTASKKNFVAGMSIPANGFFTIGMAGYASSDMPWSEQLNNTGATVFLVSDQFPIVPAGDEQVVDRVSYGTGSGLLFPESNTALLPGEGKSIERKAFRDGACVSAVADGEFLGNGCDTENNKEDFEVRAGPRGLRTGNLPEPRSAPAPVSDFRAEGLHYAWDASVDAMGTSTGLVYQLMDISDSNASVELYFGSALSYDRATNEVGRDFAASIQAVDRDGLASEPVEISTNVPSYLKELLFYGEAPDASGTIAYSVRLSWENYPFIPGTTDGWHLVVFYHNEDAKNIPFLGQLNASHNWGTGASMPSAFKTVYKNCVSTGYTNKSSALILSDEAVSCSGTANGLRPKAIDFGLLRDKVLTLPVLPQTYGEVAPVARESFVTVAFYSFVDGNPLGSDMRLVALDKTRYYLSE